MKSIFKIIAVLLFVAFYIPSFVFAEPIPACSLSMSTIELKMKAYEDGTYGDKLEEYSVANDQNLWSCFPCDTQEFLNSLKASSAGDSYWDWCPVSGSLAACQEYKWGEYKRYLGLNSQATRRCSTLTNKSQETEFFETYKAKWTELGRADDTPSESDNTQSAIGDIRDGNGQCGLTNGVCCQDEQYEFQGAEFPKPDIGGVKYIIGLLEDLVNSVKKTFYDNNSLKQIRANVPCIDGDIPTWTSASQTTKSICVCTPDGEDVISHLVNMCSNIANDNESKACIRCATTGIWTSIGCVDTNLSDFIGNTLFRIGLGFAGGMVLLCIILSAIQMQLSSNNPEKIKKAQEQITSCIVGLITIIFSIFILKVIGWDILRLPEFGTTPKSAIPIEDPNALNSLTPWPTAFRPSPTPTTVILNQNLIEGILINLNKTIYSPGDTANATVDFTGVTSRPNYKYMVILTHDQKKYSCTEFSPNINPNIELFRVSIDIPNIDANDLPEMVFSVMTSDSSGCDGMPEQLGNEFYSKYFYQNAMDSAIMNEFTPTLTPRPNSTPTPTRKPTPTALPTPTPLPVSTLPQYECGRGDPLANEIYLYDNEDFSGSCLRLTVGNYDYIQINNSGSDRWIRWPGACKWRSYDDCIASVKVGSLVQAELYYNPLFSGANLKYRSTFISKIPANMRDLTSSIRVCIVPENPPADFSCPR